MLDIEQDSENDWPLRPWIYAAILAGGGLALFFLLVWNVNYDWLGLNNDTDQLPYLNMRQGLSGLVIFGLGGFVLASEKLRLKWALAYALGLGAMMGLVIWVQSYTHDYGFEPDYRFAAALVFTALSLPIFQTFRDEGR